MPIELTEKDIAGQIKLAEFFNNRRNDKTRDYTRLILEELRGKDDVDIRIVLNALVPAHIPNESTFFRIVKDLSNPGLDIIERREDPSIIRRGKAPVFYKLKISLPWEKTELSNPQRDISNAARNYYNLYQKYGIKFEIAVQLLRKHSNLINVEDTINTIFKEGAVPFLDPVKEPDTPGMKQKIDELTDNPPLQKKTIRSGPR